MFGKILLTVTVVALIWFGFKYLGRIAELRQGGGANPLRRPSPPADAEAKAEAMVECRICGTWQPARKARSCGRADCPY
ncbi:MAG: hypothetical protein HY055_14810 [Magnetospirillum sp.]|nr:hypothetical protein [Magnetospirillum sp.]